MKLKKKVNLFGIIFPLVFGLVGAIFTVIGIVIYINGKQFFKTALPAEAVISDFKSGSDDSSTAIVTFRTQEGKELSAPLDYYSSGMKYGDRMTVYYSPQNPLKIKTRGGHLFGSICFAVIGVVFLCIFFVFIGWKVRAGRKKDYLKRNGTLVQADITDVYENMQVTMNDRHPFRISCEYKAPDGKVYTFHSGDLWYESHELPHEGKLPVYVDPRDYSRYYVDTSVLIE